MTPPTSPSQPPRRGLSALVALAAICALWAAGCARRDADGGDEPAVDTAVEVVVSVPPQAYFVERIGGERVSVRVLLPPGASPDTYDPAPRQILALGRADLFVRVGHPDFALETRHFNDLGDRHPDLEVVDMSEGIDFLTLEAGAGHGESDPHIWVAPATVEIAAPTIARALERVDPEGAEVYQRNLARFLEDLHGLDRELETAFARLPRKRFLVQHPAWGYLAHQYGLEQLAIEHGGREPEPAELVGLIEAARAADVRVIFVQRGFSDKSARVAAREIGARIVEVDPLARDWLVNLRRMAAALEEALGDDDAP